VSYSKGVRDLGPQKEKHESPKIRGEEATPDRPVWLSSF
jgi:hypothetical protein